MPASNEELKQQNAALTAALAALSASVQQHSHRDSRDTKVEIPKATREDRLAWERACLRSATQINADYLLTPQTEEEEAKIQAKDANVVRTDNKALYYRIWKSVTPAIDRHVFNVPIGDGRQLYFAIKKLLQPKTRTTRVTAQREFFQTTQTFSTGFLDYLSLLQERANTCREVGETITDEHLLNTMISGLHSSYKDIKQHITLQEGLTFDSAVETVTAWGVDNNLITDFNKEGSTSGGKPGRPALYNYQREQELKNEDHRSGGQWSFNKASNKVQRKTPRKSSKSVCHKYLWGKCTSGQNCRFAHPDEMEGQCARLPWPGTCGTCRKQGHLRQECPENKTEATSYYQEQTSKLEQVSTSDYYDDDQDSDGCEAVAFAFVKEAVTPEANTLNKHLPRPISDSGASHGITCDTNIVSNVQTNTSRVKHVGGHTTPANTATATWEVSTPGGAHSLTFPSCFYDEELGNQIISEGQATSQGYHIYKFGNLCTYSKGGTVVAICHKTNNLYPFDMATDEPCQLCLRPDIALELAHHRKAARIMNSISKNSPSALEKNNLEPSENRELQKYFEPQPSLGPLCPPNLSPQLFLSSGAPVSKRRADQLVTWHLRLGHLHFPAVCKILNIPYNSDDVRLCISCYKAKMHMLPHKKAARERAPGPLRWIWIDGYGPIDVPTPGGCRYYLIIVDDFSRKFWIFLTKTKAQWCAEFLQWKVTWENQMTTKIARVYCDVDKVFTQDAVFNKLQESGAQLLPAAPYEHWMNGLPERGHRTITESAQACRLFAGMPKTAWGEALMFALHVYNNTWTHGLTFPQTPNEAFHGRRFDGVRENIRIFGCLALPNIPKEQPERSGKLSEHSTPCVYLGPDPHREKVHRLLTWPQRKVICRYSVAFDEKVFPFRGDLSHNMTNLANYTDYDFPAIEDEDYGPLEVDPSPVRYPTRNREPSSKALENIVNSNVNFATSDAPLFSSIYATRVNWNSPPEYPMSSSLFVPRNSSEARRCKDHILWAQAEQKEIQTLRDAALMKLIPPNKQDKNIQVVNCDFRYRLKTDAEGHIIAHKARLVILGHQVNRKKANIEPEDCHASVATFASLRYHWIREHVKQGLIQLKYKPSEEQLADLLSKPVSVTTFKKLMSLGFMGNSSSQP